jgi:hypothetical protein
MFMAGSTCHVGGGTAEKDAAKFGGPVHQVGLAGWRGPEVEHLHDVRVTEPARDLGLAPKARQCLRVGGKLARHHLDGHALAEAKVDAGVHRAHATLADQALHAISALQNRADQSLRRGSLGTHDRIPRNAGGRLDNSSKAPPGTDGIAASAPDAMSEGTVTPSHDASNGSGPTVDRPIRAMVALWLGRRMKP